MARIRLISLALFSPSHWLIAASPDVTLPSEQYFYSSYCLLLPEFAVGSAMRAHFRHVTDSSRLLLRRTIGYWWLRCVILCENCFICYRPFCAFEIASAFLLWRQWATRWLWLQPCCYNAINFLVCFIPCLIFSETKMKFAIFLPLWLFSESAWVFIVYVPSGRFLELRSNVFIKKT